MKDRHFFDPSRFGRKWVAYFDLLGFSDFIKENDLGSAFYRWEQCLHEFSVNLSNCPKLEYANFSDTFLIYAPDDSIKSFIQIDLCSRWFFQHVMMRQIPMRGAMACDEFYGDKAKGIFLGRALVLAHDFGEQFNWVGFSLSPSAIERMQHPEVGLPSCTVHYRRSDVPLSKSDLVKTKAVTALLCGAGKGHMYIASLEAMKQWSIASMERKQKSDDQIRRVAEKYDNSIHFIRRFEA